MPALPPGSPLAQLFQHFSQNQSEATQHALGSGFIIDPAGYIVTNNHVVDHARKIMVTLSDGSSYAATVKGRDLSPRSHPFVSRTRSSFEPVWLGGATGRGAEPPADLLLELLGPPMGTGRRPGGRGGAFCASSAAPRRDKRAHSNPEGVLDMRSVNDKAFLQRWAIILGATKPALDQVSWAVGDVAWTRSRHAFSGPDCSHTVDVHMLERRGRELWRLLVASEHWWGPGHDPIRSVTWARVLGGDRQAVIRWVREHSEAASL